MKMNVVGISPIGFHKTLLPNESNIPSEHQVLLPTPIQMMTSSRIMMASSTSSSTLRSTTPATTDTAEEVSLCILPSRLHRRESTTLLHHHHHATATANSSHHHAPESIMTPSCLESYRLFKRCSTMNADTEGFSCSTAVKLYMSCAMDGC